MDLKIVSKGYESIVGLSNLSSNLKVNSEIYLIKEDKEVLLGFISHSLLVYFCVEFAEYALQNYAKKKIPEAEECLSIVRKWIENPNSVSSKELMSAADAAYAAADAADAYAAYAAAYAAANATYAYAAYAAAYADTKNKEFERQGRFILDYLSSNAWLFNL
jgi:hypothetical protein